MLRLRILTRESEHNETFITLSWKTWGFAWDVRARHLFGVILRMHQRCERYGSRECAFSAEHDGCERTNYETFGRLRHTVGPIQLEVSLSLILLYWVQAFIRVSVHFDG